MDRRVLLLSGAAVITQPKIAFAMEDKLRVAWKVARHGNGTYRFLVMAANFAETFNRERMNNKSYVEAMVVATGELIAHQIAELRESLSDGTDFYIKIVKPGSVGAFDVIKEVSSRAFQVAREKGGDFKVYFDDSIAPAAREKWAATSNWTRERAIPAARGAVQGGVERGRELKDRFMPQRN